MKNDRGYSPNERFVPRTELGCGSEWIQPGAWCGEMNCTIGPFSDKQQAFVYITYVIAKRMNSLSAEIVVEDSGCFIELKRPA